MVRVAESSAVSRAVVAMSALAAFVFAPRVAWAQTYSLPTFLPHDRNDPIRVQIKAAAGALTVDTTFVRLATGCDVGTNFVDINDVPASTIGPIIGYTIFDHRPVSEPSANALWNVQFTEANRAMVDVDVLADHERVINDVGLPVFVCLSTNGGVSWTQLNNEQGQSSIYVWNAVPTVTLGEVALITGQAATVQLPSAAAPEGFAGLPAVSNFRLRIVSDPVACQAASPTGLAGGTSNTFDVATASTTITLTAAAENAYACLSPNNGVSWTYVPQDNLGNSMVNSLGLTTTGEEPVVTHGFAIVPSGRERIDVSCSPSRPVAGFPVTCTVTVWNGASQVVGLSAANFRFAELTDGAGVPVCPLPPFTGSGSSVAFTFTPQRNGRGAYARILYNDLTVLVVDTNTQNSDYYTYLWGSGFTPDASIVITQRVISTRMRDRRKAHFFVDPSPLDVFPYNYNNYLKLSDFTNYGQFTAVQGIKWYMPTSAVDTVYEAMSVTLPNGVSGPRTLTRTVPVPANAERCRVTVKYLFTGETSISLPTNEFIGRILVRAQSAAGWRVVRQFDLYSYLRYVIVAGGDNEVPGQLDGYMRTEEQLAIEVPILENTNIEVSLTIDHGANSKLYFIDPRMTCAIAPSSPSETYAVKTLAADVTALGKIRTALGGTMSNWIGDPCRNHWQGILCRHNRVVEIDLRNRGLAGDFPTFTGSELSALEKIDVRNNAITGTWNLGPKSSLQEVRISNNRITSVVNAGIFTHSTDTCLAHFEANLNLITDFPQNGFTQLKALQVLDLNRNAMVNSIPAAIFSTTESLKQIHVADNGLTGSLPTALPAQTMRSADFSGNRFTGAIPATYTGFKNLQFLDVSHNLLTGKIPVISLSSVRKGHDMIFRGGHNLFTYLPARHNFQREGQMGNFFQCPKPLDKDQFWLPYRDMFELPMECDWQSAATTPLEA